MYLFLFALVCPPLPLSSSALRLLLELGLSCAGDTAVDEVPWPFILKNGIGAIGDSASRVKDIT